MSRFEVQQENGDGQILIVDDATDPDSEDHSVVNISARYGTPQSRRRLANRIRKILHMMAMTGDETAS